MVYSYSISLYDYNVLDGRLVTQIGIDYSVSYANKYEYYIIFKYLIFFNDWFSIIPKIVFFANLSNFKESIKIKTPFVYYQMGLILITNINYTKIQEMPLHQL